MFCNKIVYRSMVEVELSAELFAAAGPAAPEHWREYLKILEEKKFITFGEDGVRYAIPTERDRPDCLEEFAASAKIGLRL